ncbi:MAG: hypothetical protein GC179_15915 [Anaerolineaceae bacterium]|nr:hypothetical protein [Anaerolineaceae bacterium]
MKTQAEWNAEHDRLVGLLDQVTTELKKYPGVTSVEVGIKESGRQLTKELAFRVYVEQKIPQDQLSPDEKIPDEIFGVKTDIIQQSIPTATSNSEKFRPIKGGVQIRNDKEAGGTLGCIVQRNSDNTYVALGNYHVMFAGHSEGDTGVEIGQPKIRGVCCCNCDIIGEILDKRHDAVMDCAICSLKSEVIPTSFIRDLNGANHDGLLFGSANATVNPADPPSVSKVGATTDRTIGTIVSITHQSPPNTAKGIPPRIRQILVKPDAEYPIFQGKGDSGAVLVNPDNEVIGLMWGAYLNPTDSLYGHGVACPIADVIAAMNIRFPVGSIQTSDVLHAIEATPQTLLERADGEALVDHLQVRLSQSETGREILQLVQQHGDEIIDLINNNRAVTVTWHRKKGPAFLGAMGRSVKVATYKIPNEIDGVTRQQLFMSMATVLSEQGSSPLKQVIEKYSLPLLLWMQQSDTVDEILSLLETRQPLAPVIAE